MLKIDTELIQKDLEEEKQRFGKFRINITQRRGSNVASSSSRLNPENYFHLSDEVVVGIEDDISNLVKCLIDLEHDFKVLAIVGTGDACKTVLASHMYRHIKVKIVFTHRAFVSVSQQWSIIDILHQIYKQVTRVKDDSQIPSTDIELVRELHTFMKDKQCLVNLNDIWNKEAWNDIYPIFPRSKGCRVILTTRKEEVPLYADSKCIIHEPQLLTEEHKWELFNKIAMEGRGEIQNNPEFVKLGKDLLEKCQGLPLAVVTLASILRIKQHLYQWEEISKASASIILKGKGGLNYGVVEDMLELSYIDLPTHLKPCFLFLAVYPEDYQIDSLELDKLWIAEGFVTDDTQTGHESLEDIAMRLLNELAQRCILQVTDRDPCGPIEKFRLHDLMREFCIHKAEKYDFFWTISSTCPSVKGQSQPRRVSILSSECCVPEIEYLRTLVYFCAPSRGQLESIHDKFKLLRVLIITRAPNGALPKQIGNLINLTYLRLYDTGIGELPKSIRKLRNLLYLECTNFAGQVEAPNDLVLKMENLRALDLLPMLKRGGSKSSFNRRLGLNGAQKKLHTLKCGAGTWMTTELPMLTPTLQNLQINDIRTMEEVEAIYQCPSILEDSLCTLKVFDFIDAMGVTDNVACKFDLVKLRDCTALHALGLRCPLGGSIQFPPNLVTLGLYSSRIGEGVDLMEVLGQLSKLKYLALSDGAYLGTQLSCAGNAFPQLEVLDLSGLPTLEEWRMEDSAMDCLKKLLIYD